jgi:hypothetical protein
MTSTGRAPLHDRRLAPGTAFVTGAALAVIGAVVVLLIVLQLARNPNVKNQLGAAVFTVGKADDLYHQIVTPGPDGRKGPLLFQALVRDRDIYVQHLGPEPLTGWLAFEAHAPGTPRSCVLQWIDAQSDFHDPCGGRTYPADGTGLIHFRTTVVKDTNRVVVDLRQPLP